MAEARINVCDFVKEIRKKKNLTQGQLDELITAPRNTIQRLENPGSTLRKQFAAALQLIAIAEELGIDVLNRGPVMTKALQLLRSYSDTDLAILCRILEPNAMTTEQTKEGQNVPAAGPATMSLDIKRIADNLDYVLTMMAHDKEHNLEQVVKPLTPKEEPGCVHGLLPKNSLHRRKRKSGRS